MVLDIQRACHHGACRRNLYIRLTPEDQRGACGDANDCVDIVVATHVELTTSLWSALGTSVVGQFVADWC